MESEELNLMNEVTIGSTATRVGHLPEGLRMDEDLGLVCAATLEGQLVYRAPGEGWLYETRATRPPGGDYLLMFPTNTPEWPSGAAHYGGAPEGQKVNQMLALRSSDGGRSWSAPTVAFDIDYNQHGFIPFIPKGSTRIYAFGTQPIWGTYSQRDGLSENAPIGYRYSDDDGHTWSEVRLIRPTNDPGYTGMSVMRMCETAEGTWLLGTHEGDWSYKPLMTRQYLLRSEDQGKTWELLPGKRHGGWFAKGFNRMDEGRPIDVGDGEVLLMTRTCEGHLWTAWSRDDGKSWTDPAPSTLAHPDAPPMVFPLSEGKTLAAFHHNRASDVASYSGLGGKLECMQDRAQIWLSLSHDGGHHWTEPRFVCANAVAPEQTVNNFRSYQCSYLDAFADNGVLQIFMPHRWQRCLHLRLPESALDNLPTMQAITH